MGHKEKTGEGVHNGYRKDARNKVDVLWKVKIKGRKYLVDEIPFHMSLRVFDYLTDKDMDRVKEKVREFDIKTPDPKNLKFKTTIFHSKHTGKDYFMLKVSGIDDNCKKFFDAFKDGYGFSHKEFMAHITIDKPLYNSINKYGLKPEEIEFSALTIEDGADNTVHEFRKSEPLEKDRPMITMPKVRGTSTRPDQEVQHMSNQQQRDLYTRRVVNAHPMTGPALPHQIQDAKNRAAANIGHKFVNRTSVTGMSWTTPEGPKSSVKTSKPPKSIEAIKNHEALHHVMSQIEHLHGKEARFNAVNKLLEQHHPETVKHMSTWIRNRGYDPEHPHFNEEILAHARDILADPKVRYDFEQHIGGDEQAKEHIKNLKMGHQKAYKFAQQMTPKDFVPEQAPGETKLAASEPLEKDRPAITLPKVPGTSTRPDQEVQNIGNRRQSAIYNRKIVSAHLPNQPGENPEEAQGARDAEVYGLESQHMRNPWKGLAAKTPHGPKSAVKVPWHRDKPDEDAHPSWHPIWRQDIKDTGQQVEAAKHHEGLHHVMWQIEDKHGPKARENVINKLVAQHHPEAMEAVRSHTAALGYDPKNQYFDEEALNNARDILVHPEKRKSFIEHIGDDKKAAEHIKNLKSGHQRAYKLAQQITPRDFAQEELPGQVKLAASEDLNKGIKHAAAGLGAVASMAGASINKEPPQPKPTQTARAAQQPVKSPYSSKRMLNAIAQVESNKGKFTEHHPVGGIHHGESAIGRYALMPNTIRETIHMNPDLKQHAKAMKLRGDDMRRYMEDNPGLEDTVAQKYLARLEHHFGQDPAKLGYSWLNGVHGTYRAIQNKEDIPGHWHAKKVLDAYGKEK